MNIRSITCFLNPGFPLNRNGIAGAGKFLQQARHAYTESGYTVQSCRLATIPFSRLAPNLSSATLVRYVQELEEISAENDIEYVSIGPALLEDPGSYAVIPEILSSTQRVFASGVVSDMQGVSLAAIQACAKIIRELSTVEDNGFGNLYFAALANVPPGVPFFPAAYHAGDFSGFGLALEAADLAVQIFQEASDLDTARQNLIQAIETHARRLSYLGEELARTLHTPFLGLDFTLAPFPETHRSMGTALENLGVPAVGLQGTLAAATFLTDTLDRAAYPRTGLNGLMLPVLEDATLALRASEGHLRVNDLLLYSAVCGTGLDTVPLPGETSVEALAALLLDIAALANRLDKPLTARLLPIPGKRAGEPTGFDFAYFANSRVMALDARPLTGKLATTEILQISPRSTRV
jgi:uncharacterized protein (UPF0210 family)